jgi:hypothetical protein
MSSPKNITVPSVRRFFRCIFIRCYRLERWHRYPRYNRMSAGVSNAVRVLGNVSFMIPSGRSVRRLWCIGLWGSPKRPRFPVRFDMLRQAQQPSSTTDRGQTRSLSLSKGAPYPPSEPASLFALGANSAFSDKVLSIHQSQIKKGLSIFLCDF